jgi:hypothetical protein
LSNGIQFTKKDSSDTVIIPYGTNLSNIGIGLTIEDIKTINPYLGIDEYYPLIDNYQIPIAKDEKFFQYYRKVYGGNLIDFGVLVRAYKDLAALNLFKINKYGNIINIGRDCSTIFSSNTVIKGNLRIQNNNGTVIYNNGNEARLKVKYNDVSFEDDNSPKKNIVLARGLRISVTDNEVVFHKPGDTITDNSSPNQVKLPFGLDLTNIGSGSNSLIAFRQSLIENAIVNNPNYGLYQLTMSELKIYTPIKTLVGEEVFPKTTHVTYCLLYFIH